MWNHVSQPLTSSGAAVNIVIDELTRVASAAGCRSTIVAAGNRDIALSRAELLPVDFSGHAYTDHGQLFLRERLGDAVSGWTGRSRKHVARMYRPIGDALRESEGPIIVHDGYLGAAGLETLRRMYPDRPLFLWMHNTLSPAYAPREVRRFLSFADTVICISDWIRESVSRAARSTSLDSRLATVLNGVDSDRFRPAQRDDDPSRVPSILFVGRVVRVKGPDVLASALSDLHEQGVDFRATFVGVAHPDISQGSKYEQAVLNQTSGFADKVSFVPFRANSELPDLYRRHDIGVVPSRFEEPFSLALAEGMASGLAMVAARRGGMPQVGQNSIQYFERRDQLTGALRSLLQDAQMRNHWGGLARVRAEHLSWSRAFDAARGLISPS